MDNSNTTGNPIPVVVERAQPHVRRYNVGTQLSEYPVVSFKMPVRQEAYGMREIGESGRNLVTAIRDTVPGVEEVYLSRYAIQALINVAFEWEIVEPAILAAIEDSVGPISVRQSEPMSSDDIFVVGILREFFDDDSSDDGVDGSNTSDEVDADGASDEVDDLN